MARLWDKNRRKSTIFRDNYVHDVYNKVVSEMGDLANYVARSEIYRRVSAITHLCPKTIERIINHTHKTIL